MKIIATMSGSINVEHDILKLLPLVSLKRKNKVDEVLAVGKVPYNVGNGDETILELLKTYSDDKFSNVECEHHYDSFKNGKFVSYKLISLCAMEEYFSWQEILDTLNTALSCLESDVGGGFYRIFWLDVAVISPLVGEATLTPKGSEDILAVAPLTEHISTIGAGEWLYYDGVEWCADDENSYLRLLISTKFADVLQEYLYPANKEDTIYSQKGDLLEDKIKILFSKLNSYPFKNLIIK